MLVVTATGSPPSADTVPVPETASAGVRGGVRIRFRSEGVESATVGLIYAPLIQ